MIDSVDIRFLAPAISQRAVFLCIELLLMGRFWRGTSPLKGFGPPTKIHLHPYSYLLLPLYRVDYPHVCGNDELHFMCLSSCTETQSLLQICRQGLKVNIHHLPL